MNAGLAFFVATTLAPLSGAVFAGPQTELEAAGIELALAANCRASYGDQELFEVAFARFEAIARASQEGVTDEMLEESRQKLYQMDAQEGDNPFMRGFCEKLREELLPDAH